MNKSLFFRLFFPVAGIFVLILMVVAWYVPALVERQAVEAALGQAERSVAQFKTIRAYYTRNVIAKVKGKGGITPSFEHRDNPDAIPLPATMIHDLSGLLEGQGTRLRLYSAFPFPNRASRRLDDFQQEAWRAVNRDPDTPFVRTISRPDGSTTVRVAIADRMVAEACVACHNGHPDTPRNDWKLGDVRGVLEIETPIDDQLVAGARLSGTILGLVAGGGVVLLLGLSLIYRRSIGRPLEEVVAALDQVADGDGDLTRRLPAHGSHEIARIGEAFNRFADRLSRTLVEVRGLTEELGSISGEVAAASRETSRRISGQERETQQVAAAVHQMEATAHEIAGSASGVADATERAADAAGQGAEVVNLSVEATRRLSDDIGRAAEALAQLKQNSDDIGGVLEVIRGIAEQTNLLALNAAIEAARAGEQGRGFAVVADEVRTLAGRTQESTRQIQEMTERLRTATDEVVRTMDQGHAQAETTVELAGKVGTHLHHISDSVRQLRDMTTQIATAAEEQGQVVSEVNRNLGEIAEASGMLLETGEENASHAARVAELGSRLRQLIGHFRL